MYACSHECRLHVAAYKRTILSKFARIVILKLEPLLESLGDHYVEVAEPRPQSV